MTVGVHEPPFAIDLLRPEEARGLELRAGSRAAVFVPTRWFGLRGHLLRFPIAIGGQIVEGLDFAGPILVAVLAEGVDERTERVGIGDKGRRRGVGAGGVDLGN